MKFSFKNKSNTKRAKLDINLRSLDSDRDGLTDHEEINIYGTDPKNPDTDKDGVSDYEEIKMGRNPLGSGKLRDLFIPNVNNGYKPNILHPYRLIFYTFSVLAVQFIVIGFVLLFPISAWLTPDILTQESKKVIELTNKIRQNLSVGSLSEQSLLNQAAYDKAQDMLVRQYFAHVGPDSKDLADWILKNGYQYSVAGENLAIGFTSAEDVVEAWTKSRTHYSNLIDQDFKEIGVGMVSGPFNGYETTLVAQYFASGSKSNVVIPAIKPQPVKAEEKPKITPEIIEESEPVNTNQNISTSTNNNEPIIPIAGEEKQIPENNVEGEKVDVSYPGKPTLPKLEPPVLISHQNGSVIRQEEVKLVVFAPQANEVVVFDGGIQIGKRASFSSQYFDFYFTFHNGKHKLNFKSVSDGRERLSEDYYITIDIKDQMVDVKGSKLVVLQPQGQQEQIIKAKVYLDNDIAESWVEFSGYRIDLEKVGQEGELNQWEGQLVIFDSDKKKIFDTITLPVLNTKNVLGETKISDIAWENITPVRPSLLKQYFFIKSHPLKDIDILFSVESLFYKIILVVAIISLILNIFIEIKKQYPQVILSTLGFISLLIVLILI